MNMMQFGQIAGYLNGYKVIVVPPIVRKEARPLLDRIMSLRFWPKYRTVTHELIPSGVIMRDEARQALLMNEATYKRIQQDCTP